MSTPTRAVVVGAGMAGLVAARVLSDAVDEVLILERDPTDALGLSTATGAAPGVGRPGVPQSGHVHLLLRRGYRELTRLLPDLDRQLAAAGAPLVDWINDAVWITPGGEAARRPSRYRTRSASRYLLERVIRDLVLARPNVELRAGHDVIGLLTDAEAVTGVRYRLRGRGAEGDVEGPDAIGAWLVLDASGRSSRLPEMLAEAGMRTPEETTIDASLRYATRVYRRPGSSAATSTRSTCGRLAIRTSWIASRA
jgi:flavin-dependent dehydrogenase